MVCQGCFTPAETLVCRQCRASLRPPPEKILPGGVRLVSAFEHTGAAARLVHGLKYRGLVWYAEMVAETLAPLLPRAPLVPIPRAWSRFARYGVDPAREIARRIARINRVALVDLFRRPIHSARRAGGDHGRLPGSLAIRTAAPGGVLIVDDVVTTGATMLAAVNAVGSDRVIGVVAANDATARSTLAGNVLQHS